MDQDQVRRNDAERDRLLRVNAPVPGARPSMDPPRGELVSLERIIRERDRLLHKIREARELADHYMGDLWPQEVKDAARTMLELLDKDVQAGADCICPTCGRRHGAPTSEEGF